MTGRSKKKYEITWIGIWACLSLVNLVFTIYMAISGHFAFPSGDSYITIMITLLGFCTTFIIGYQIYNAIEIKNEIKELKEAKEQIKETAELNLYFSAYAIGRIHMQNGNYLNAFRAFHNALFHALQTKYVGKVDEMLEEMRSILNKLDCYTVSYHEKLPSILQEIEDKKDLIFSMELLSILDLKWKYKKVMDGYDQIKEDHGWN